VINTHLGLVPLEQRAQVRCLLGKDWLEHEDCRTPAMLIGDFNATSRYAAYGALTERLQDAQRLLQKSGKRPRPARTFPSRWPMLRIDHLFVDRGIEVVDAHVSSGPLARSASDHLPLVFDVEVRGG
jgi:endonuclease/exonuclease/phosphatase family metal-dependent hydrolase